MSIVSRIIVTVVVLHVLYIIYIDRFITIEQCANCHVCALIG